MLFEGFELPGFPKRWARIIDPIWGTLTRHTAERLQRTEGLGGFTCLLVFVTFCNVELCSDGELTYSKIPLPVVPACGKGLMSHPPNARL